MKLLRSNQSHSIDEQEKTREEGPDLHLALKADLVKGGVHVEEPTLDHATRNGKARMTTTQGGMSLPLREEGRATEALDEELQVKRDSQKRVIPSYDPRTNI